MPHYGIELNERDIMAFGEGVGMTSRDQLIDYFPTLVTYYFGHLNVHKDRITDILVEEHSLAPVILESTLTMEAYFAPLLNNGTIVFDSLCYYAISPEWLAIGFSVAATELTPERNTVYLTRAGSVIPIPMTINPTTEVTKLYSIH